MTLLELADLLRKHLVLVLVLPMAAAMVAFGIAMALPNEYTASSTMYVLVQNDAEEDSSLTRSDFDMGQMITNDVATLIKSDRIKGNVAQKFGLESLARYKVNVTNATNTRVITLSVTSQDPEMAARVCNAITEEVSDVAIEVMQIQSINVIDTAAVPTSPSGPNRLMYTLVGGMAGFFLAVVIVVIRDMVDTRVREGGEVEDIMGVPVVGHFPQMDL